MQGEDRVMMVRCVSKNWHLAVLWVVGTVIQWGCEGASDPVWTEQRGDTLVVLGSGTPRFPTRVARMDLRIGEVEGDPNLSFGRLEELALLPSGGFVVYDNHFMRISRFDSAGRFVGELGDLGEGPGQFDAVMGLAASLDGLIYVRSYDGRVLVFRQDSNYRGEWRPSFRIAMEDPLVPTNDSLLGLRVIERQGSMDAPTLYGFVTVDANWQVVDSTGPVTSPWTGEVTRGQPTLASIPFVALSPAGFMVSGVTGRYAFQVQRSGGGIIRVERDVEPTPFLRDEWRDWEEQNAFLRRRSGDPARYPTTPEHKPPIRAVFLPPNGQIWIQRSTRSVGPDPGHVEMVAGLRATPEWLEPLLFEVFTPDGTYLGAVMGPPGVDVRAVYDDSIWGYTNGKYGEQYVVRLVVEELPS